MQRKGMHSGRVRVSRVRANPRVLTGNIKDHAFPCVSAKEDTLLNEQKRGYAVA